MLAESLFKVFDDDNSGTFSFEEYYQVFRLITKTHLMDVMLYIKRANRDIWEIALLSIGLRPL